MDWWLAFSLLEIVRRLRLTVLRLREWIDRVLRSITEK